MKKDTEFQLDARKIEPRFKHPTIFETFNKLQSGESFILINDHDPRPLRFQFIAGHGEDSFSWHYLKKGPGEWRIRIGKK